ncbi:SDR family oxidoreductase [Streptacidiphilus sp. PB12-B1b]|uniref:SDR family NAD(P)-dependent oxidoreductase n=1 Tax=Streptacidiphilus sp. PB12-B1b TaxID=2705012 RepID=UPI0015FDD920|nr:SDR family NAD(P)-dependent oxidoreductase [Streptacidiphilus sp. PB12-B1b]QMU78287.1 SDR family oxidoreductase [Streptacidiphilus sp. PB12-B1b]
MSNGTVFVTGGSRGIGLAVCEALMSEGYTVVAVARQATPELVDLMARSSGTLRFERADLSVELERTGLALRLRACRDLYGLVNNAGVATAGLHVGLAQQEWSRMWDLNVLTPMVLCQAAAKSMRRARQGKIVNISSISAHKTFRGLAAYTATKSAVEGFSRVFAAETGAWGITVNCVAPGFIATDMTAGIPDHLRERIMKRNALDHRPTAQDVARTVVFLLSDAAAAVTAQVVRVDSGATA